MTNSSFSSLQRAVRNKINNQGTVNKYYDVMVIGVGSMGSAACYYLARQGVKVLGIEQFTISHDRGAHTGQSRIVRKAYYEHPNYVPLLERAYLNWKAIEAESETALYFETGMLHAGTTKGSLISGIRKSAQQYQLSVEEWTTAQVTNTFTPFSLPDHYDLLYEMQAGLVTPERAILIYVEQALAAGAYITMGEKTISWQQKGAIIEVKTDKRSYQCKKLIISAGAWIKQLVPILEDQIFVSRQVLAWMEPKRYKDFEMGSFPCWMIEDQRWDGMFYGFPIIDKKLYGQRLGFKLAHHHPGKRVEAGKVNSQNILQEEKDILKFLNSYMPNSYKNIQSTKTCLYTNTTDSHFILDFDPENENIILAGGFSGHGFKFVSAIGEILADLAIRGQTDLPIDFLSLKRFKSLKPNNLE